MQETYLISLYLDTRYKKASGKYPLKLRVYDSRTKLPRLYKTKHEFTTPEYESIYLSKKPRKEYRDIRKQLLDIEAKANDAAKKLKVFTFDGFEKILFGSRATGANVKAWYEATVLKKRRGRKDRHVRKLRAKLEIDFYILPGKEKDQTGEAIIRTHHPRPVEKVRGVDDLRRQT